MNNLLKKVKITFTNFWNSTPMKIVKAATYVAAGILLVTGLMQTMTLAVNAFNGLSKALAA